MYKFIGSKGAVKNIYIYLRITIVLTSSSGNKKDEGEF